MKTQTQTDDEREEAFRDMQTELQSGECARIDSPASGPERVTYCGRFLGVIDAEAYDKARGGGSDRFSAVNGTFRSVKHALRGIARAADAAKFYPNVYAVNERGNVTQLHPVNGRELASFV